MTLDRIEGELIHGGRQLPPRHPAIEGAALNLPRTPGLQEHAVRAEVEDLTADVINAGRTRHVLTHGLPMPLGQRRQGGHRVRVGRDDVNLGDIVVDGGRNVDAILAAVVAEETFSEKLVVREGDTSSS